MKRCKKTAGRGETAREKAWAYIRKTRRVTVPDLMENTGISQSNAQSLIQDLKQADLLTRDGRQAPNGANESWGIYRVTDDPPKVPAAVVVQSPAWRQQAWNALRIHRTCSVPDMMRTFSDDVDIAEDTVYRYVRKLERVGILLRRGRSGKSGQKGSYVHYTIHPSHERPNAPTPTELRKLT